MCSEDFPSIFSSMYYKLTTEYVFTHLLNFIVIKGKKIRFEIKTQLYTRHLAKTHMHFMLLSIDEKEPKKCLRNILKLTKLEHSSIEKNLQPAEMYKFQLNIS